MSYLNTIAYRGAITRNHRESLLSQKSLVFWFTGLSGSRKSTIAHAVEERLHSMGKLAYVFDGDNVRKGLCNDLDFSDSGRAENLRRITEMIKLFSDAGVICLAAFISPVRIDREKCRHSIGLDRFFEIYVKCPLQLCEQRDVKGLYKKARLGEIQHYTGVSAPYEEPLSPSLVLNTEISSLEECVNNVVALYCSVEQQMLHLSLKN